MDLAGRWVSKWQSAQLQPYASAAAKQFRAGDLPLLSYQSLPRIATYRINQCCANIIGIIKRGIRQDLIKVSTVGFALIVGELLPAEVIKFGEMGFGFSIDYID